MRKTVTVMTMVMALVLSTMSMALADTDLWDNDDVLDSDDTDTTVPRPFEPDPDPEPDPIPQDASITLTGPEFLDVDEEGTYTVEVTNASNDRDLDEWVLGLSVTNIESADDLTIKFTGSNFDITEGSAGVEVEVDTANDVIYLRGSDDPTIPVNQSETFTFEASFAKEGDFTGTAFVIDEDPFRSVEFEEQTFVEYFNKDGGTDTNVPPPTKPLSGDGQNFEQGAEYEFDFCTLDRTRYEIGGDRVLSINNQRCFNDGEVEYQHRAVLMNQAHPDFDDTPGAVGFGGVWKVIEFDVLVPAGITVDPTDFADINTWSTFPA